MVPTLSRWADWLAGKPLALWEWVLAPLLFPSMLGVIEIGHWLVLRVDRRLRFEDGWLHVGRLRVRPEGVCGFDLVPIKGYPGIWECVVSYHIGFSWEPVRSWSMLIDEFAAAKAFRSRVLADFSHEDRCALESGELA